MTSHTALEALYTMQPSVVEQELLNALFCNDLEFDNEILARGLNNSNALVRTTSSQASEKAASARIQRRRITFER